MSKEKNDNESYYLKIILISLILFALGIIINFYFYTIKKHEFWLLFTPVVFNAIGYGVLYKAFDKEVREDLTRDWLRSIKRKNLNIGLSLIVIGLLFIVMLIFIPGAIELDWVFILNSGSLILFGVALVLLVYLDNSEWVAYDPKTSNEIIEEEPEKEFDIVDGYFLDDFHSLTFDEFLKQISTFDRKLEYRLAKTFERIGQQLYSVKKQANVNLISGATIAIIGFITLAVLIYLGDEKDPESFTAKFIYISRFSVVLLIEALAFFFLKLYKENLNEIKYYQNELTNIEMKYLALAAAKESSKETDLSEVIKSLSITERNFILKKGETTVHMNSLGNEAALLSSISNRFERLNKN